VTVLFVRVDPDDAETLAEYMRITDEAQGFDDPYYTPLLVEEKREVLRNQVSTEVVEAYLGRVDDGFVASGLIELPLLDNTDKAWLETSVPSPARGHGHGTAMLTYLEGLARQHDRITLMAEVGYPFDADDDHPDRKFATNHGYRFSQANVQRVLQLPVDGDLLDGLRSHASERHADYTFVEYVGLVPSDIVDEYCVLLNTIIVDAPSGALTYDEGGTTPASLAQLMDSLAAQGRTMYTSVAYDAQGTPVAHNQLVVSAHDPVNVFNWDTMVRREHRGHRLGLASKVRNLGVMQREHPTRTALHTWNAESNDHMIAVNEAMGFVPVRYHGEYYRTL